MNDPSWREVTAYLNNSIELQRTRIEARGQDHDETNFIRGLIAAYREILQLPETTVANQSDRRMPPLDLL